MSEKLNFASQSLHTLTEIAELLRVSPKTVYYWVSRSEIPYLKVGRHLRFNPHQVLSHFAPRGEHGGPASCSHCEHALAFRSRAWSLKNRGENCWFLTKGIGNGHYQTT